MITRRTFLLSTGLAAFAAPLHAFQARIAEGASLRAIGYGPLDPAVDQTTGVKLLELAAGLRAAWPQLGGVLQPDLVARLNAIERRERFARSFVFDALREQQPRDDVIRGERAGQIHLLMQRWSAFPVVEDVRDAAAFEH